MHLVLDTNGLLLSKRNGCFLMATKAARRMVAPSRVESIVVSAACRLSTEALLLAEAHGIPVIFLDGAGRPRARIWSATHTHGASVRRAQAVFAQAPAATGWCVALFAHKLHGQLANLRWLERHRASARPALKEAQQAMAALADRMDAVRQEHLPAARSTLMGLEGAMARSYWRIIGQLMPAPFSFTERSRRPAQDPFNALLNYGYGMLYAQVESTLLRCGLDPAFGVLHTDGHGRHGLTYDLVEPFRPWVDRLVMDGCLHGHFTPASFQAKGQGIWLAKPGKHLLIPAFMDMLHGVDGLGDERARRSTLLLRTIRRMGEAMLEGHEGHVPEQPEAPEP